MLLSCFIYTAADVINKLIISTLRPTELILFTITTTTNPGSCDLSEAACWEVKLLGLNLNTHRGDSQHHTPMASV